MERTIHVSSKILQYLDKNSEQSHAFCNITHFLLVAKQNYVDVYYRATLSKITSPAMMHPCLLDISIVVRRIYVSE